MRLFNTVTALREYLDETTHAASDSNEPMRDRRTVGLVKVGLVKVGLVPTMGALHEGHRSLMVQARQTSDIVIVSIFVNPLQFGPNEDLARYPRPQQEDQALCKAAGVDVIFMPSPVDLYGTPRPDLSTVTQVVPPVHMTQGLCGRARPTHFRGVATVITKLLNIVRPTYAFFGQKDAQQVAILKQLAQDLNLTGEIVPCPIVREPDGLAMSSRNRYLVGPERQQALVLQKSLQAVKQAFEQGARSHADLQQAAQAVLATEPSVILDYLELVHPDTLKPLQAVNTLGMMAIAAHVGKARLLDNVVLNAETVNEKADGKADRKAPIIAIDGPAGAGKSTVARQLAHNLSLLYLDTGAMYRALTWYVLQQGVDPTDEAAVGQLLPQCQIKLIANVENDTPQPPKVTVNGEDVTAAIRTAGVTGQVSTIAAQAAVRTKLVEQQQQYGLEGGVVADGRDIGTKVFPDAEVKIYLTASVEERARRRSRDLAAADQPLPDLKALAQSIAERDQKDSTRAVSPLCQADDAIKIITDDLTAEQVIEKIAKLYTQKLADA